MFFLAREMKSRGGSFGMGTARPTRLRGSSSGPPPDPARHCRSLQQRPRHRLLGDIKHNITSRPSTWIQAAEGFVRQVGAGNVPAGWPAGMDPLTRTPSEIIQSYYEAINRRLLDRAVAMYAEDCIHHNLAFSEPAVGPQEVRKFVYNFCKNIPVDLQFVIDDISGGRSVGVIWHMEVGGVELPMGKGMSFYQLNNKGRITYVRECPEHFAKVASASPLLLRVAAPFLRNRSILPEYQSLTSTLEQEIQRATEAVMSVAAPMTAHVASLASPPRVTPAQPQPQRVPTSTETDLVEVSTVDDVGGDVSGTWIRESRQVDEATYDRALKMMGMSGIFKTAVELINGMVLSQNDNGVILKYLASMPNFPEVNETYRYSEWLQIDRRDMKDGWQKTKASKSEQGELILHVEFGPTDAWTVKDRYELVSMTELHVHSEIRGAADPGPVHVTTVFRRQ